MFINFYGLALKVLAFPHFVGNLMYMSSPGKKAKVLSMA
jgi:hypothetical protein